MRYSVGVEYAFHTLFYMVEMPSQSVIGIRALAELHGISETYLSKIFTKLSKSGLVRAVSGVKGGYVLQRPAAQISFWDIIEAVDGNSYLFQCAEIRQRNTLSDPASLSFDCPCAIKVIISEGEDRMREYLRQQTLGELYKETFATFSEEKQQAIYRWLEKIFVKYRKLLLTHQI